MSRGGGGVQKIIMENTTLDPRKHRRPETDLFFYHTFFGLTCDDDDDCALHKSHCLLSLSFFFHPVVQSVVIESCYCCRCPFVKVVPSVFA